MRTLSHESRYDRMQIEAQFDTSPTFMLSRALGDASLPGARDSFDFYAVRNTHGVGKEIFPLATHTGEQIAEKVAAAPKDFSCLLAKLADQVASVLSHQDDPIALEHHAVLFWPSLDALHAFLGMNLRADEVIAACDVFRSQFRLRPVTAAALKALENVLRAATYTDVFTTEKVDGWLDQLEHAGVDQRFPLSFEPSHAE